MSVILTVYVQADIAEVSRVLQTLVLQPLMVERFCADMTIADVRRVSGLEHVRERVIRLTIVATAVGERDVERVTKALNRLVAVHKIIPLDV